MVLMFMVDSKVSSMPEMTRPMVSRTVVPTNSVRVQWAVYVYHSRISFRPPLAGEFCVLIIIYDILWSLARLCEGRALIVAKVVLPSRSPPDHAEGCFAGREKRWRLG